MTTLLREGQAGNTPPIEDIDIFKAFDITIDLCKEAYDPTATTDLLEGEFPVVFRKIGNTLFCVFRGTRNDFSTLKSSLESIKNMIVDCSVGDVLGEDTSLAEFGVFNSRLDDLEVKLTGHAGFMKELSIYYLDIKTKISNYYGNATNIVFSGHSAGGALATLMNYVYVNDTFIDDKLPVYYTITYGSPRVIKNTINNKELYTKACPNVMRCFNANDIVTYIPFNKQSSYLGTMGSGFTHVGKPIPMDTNIETNSLNALVLQVLRGNKGVFSQILKRYTFDELRENNFIGLITSDKYLGLTATSMFECFQKVGVKEDVSDEMIKASTNALLTDSQNILDYALKCDLAQPLGISEILKVNNIFDSEIQEDIGISSITGSLMGYNKLSVEAHDLNMYRENALNFEMMELETGTTFWGRGERKKEEAEGTYPLPPIPIPVTINKVYIDLIGEILKDIESGKIVGAIPIDEGDLPAMIEY